jgi:hypothetical protein
MRRSIGNNVTVRRPIAGLLFAIAFGCACVAVGGWLLQRTVLSPQRIGDSAAEMMQDAELRNEFSQLIVAGTAEAMYPGDTNAPIRVLATVDQVLSIPAGAHLAADVFADAQAHLVGRTEAPVLVSPAQLVQIVRDERAAVVPAMVLDVPQVGTWSAIDSVLDLLVPIAAIAALVFFVLCLLTRPEADVLARSVGIGLMVMAGVVFVFGFVIPAFVPPLLDDSLWSRLTAAAAQSHLTGTMVMTLVLAAIGIGLYTMSTRMGRRSRWSAPISTYRYREDRRWS